MKFVIFAILALSSITGFAQTKKGPPKKSTTPVPSVKEEPRDTANYIYKSDTVKIRFSVDNDSLGYVEPQKGYIIQTTTSSKRFGTVSKEEAAMYDEAWRRINENHPLISNIRRAEW